MILEFCDVAGFASECIWIRLSRLRGLGVCVEAEWVEMSDDEVWDGAFEPFSARCEEVSLGALRVVSSFFFLVDGGTLQHHNTAVHRGQLAAALFLIDMRQGRDSDESFFGVFLDGFCDGIASGCLLVRTIHGRKWSSMLFAPSLIGTLSLSPARQNCIR